MVTSTQATLRARREVPGLDSRMHRRETCSPESTRQQGSLSTPLSQPVSLYTITILRTSITFPELDDPPDPIYNVADSVANYRPHCSSDIVKGVGCKHGARQSHDGSRYADILERPGLGRRSRRGHGSRLRRLHVEGQAGHCLCLVPADQGRTGQDSAGEHSMLLSPWLALTLAPGSPCRLPPPRVRNDSPKSLCCASGVPPHEW